MRRLYLEEALISPAASDTITEAAMNHIHSASSGAKDNPTDVTNMCRLR